MAKKLHVGNTARDLLNELKKTYEFNSLEILNIEAEGIWHREYAVFIIEIDTYVPDLDDNPYLFFDLSEFWRDFDEFLAKWFPNCQIRRGYSEIEVCGPNYQEFYDKYSEKIEKFSDDNDDKFKRGEIVIWEPRKPRVKK